MTGNKRKEWRAIDDLTPLQQEWVKRMIEVGNSLDAARLAGYGAESATRETKDSACRAAAFANERNPKIIEALREEAGIMLDVGVIIGAKTLVTIAQDPAHKDQYKAAVRLAELGGFQVVAKQEINVNHTNSDQATLLARANEIIARLGLAPEQAQALLGRYAPAIDPNGRTLAAVDAEFTVVQDAPASTKGLEDIL